jgi:hypothetical protein
VEAVCVILNVSTVIESFSCAFLGRVSEFSIDFIFFYFHTEGVLPRCFIIHFIYGSSCVGRVLLVIFVFKRTFPFILLPLKTCHS